MSQDTIVRMRSTGDENGVGKNHEIRMRFNKKGKVGDAAKLEIKRYNPIARKHTTYKLQGK